MNRFPLKNANASVVTVTNTATLLTALLNTAGGDLPVLPTSLNAVNLVAENGDIRYLADGNTPTATKGILLKSGAVARLRGVDIDAIMLIRVGATSVSVGVEVGIADVGDGDSSDQGENPAGYSNITATGAVKSTAGVVSGFIINSHTNGTLKLWDNTAGSGAVLMNTYTFPAGSGVVTFPKPVQFNTGLFATVGGTLDITIIYK